MPNPGPARFDAHDRHTLGTFLLAALGPTLSMSALFAGYSLSTRLCEPGYRAWIVSSVALAVAGCVAATGTFARRKSSNHSVSESFRFLEWNGLLLSGFCLCVVIAFAFALGTEVHCE